MIQRKKGAIVNVGSAAGEVSCGDPLYAVYSGSKAYVDFFSRSLNLELQHKGVHVQVWDRQPSSCVMRHIDSDHTCVGARV